MKCNKLKTSSVRKKESSTANKQQYFTFYFGSIGFSWKYTDRKWHNAPKRYHVYFCEFMNVRMSIDIAKLFNFIFMCARTYTEQEQYVTTIKTEEGPKKKTN
jgi:hypothetical protein